jgi:hypothetical protein
MNLEDTMSKIIMWEIVRKKQVQQKAEKELQNRTSKDQSNVFNKVT